MFYSTSNSNQFSLPKGQIALACCLVSIAVLAVIVTAADEERLRIENRKQKESVQDIADTINYLEDVDRFYSQVSRPRFGRSEYKQKPSTMPDRLVDYRIATGDRAAASQPAHWALESLPEIVSLPAPTRHPTFAEILKRRLAEQTGPSYESIY